MLYHVIVNVYVIFVGSTLAGYCLLCPMPFDKMDNLIIYILQKACDHMTLQELR